MNQAASRPSNEAERLLRLHALEILDSDPEPIFDALARTAAQVCQVPIALITLVDAERQWFKSNIGLDGVRQIPRDIGFCAHAILGRDLMEIADARQRDVVEVRRSLEVEAARLAARRRTETDVALLRRLRDERAAAYREGDLERMVSTDLDLHRTIAITARNPVLLSLYENLLDAITDNIRFNFTAPEHGDDSHDGLVDAIANGDAAMAAREVTTYLSELLGDHAD